MRIAVFNVESLGHMVPTLAVAKLLGNATSHVCCLLHRDHVPSHQLIRQSGFELEYLPGDGSDSTSMALTCIERLAAALTARHVDILLTGSLCLKGPIAAELAGVADLRIVPNPFLFTETGESPFVDVPPPPNPRRAVPRAPGASATRFERMNELRRRFGLEPRSSLQLLQSPLANLVLVDERVPQLKPSTETTLVAGPVLGDPGDDERPTRNHDVEAATQPELTTPIVYLTLGTEVIRGERGRRFLDQVARQIAKSSGPPLDLRVYLGTRPAHSDLAYVSPLLTPLSGVIDQRAEIRKADLVVSHGGWNTVHEAIWAGKPQLIVPFEGHHPVTAQWAQEQGLGRWCTPEELLSGDPARVIRELLQNRDITTAVRRFSPRLHDPQRPQRIIDFATSRLQAHQALATAIAPATRTSPRPSSTQLAKKPSRFTMVCGVATVEGLERAVEAGASEVFCGVHDPGEPNGFRRVLNRRESPDANLQGLSALDQLLARADQLNVRVGVTLNEVFTEAQQPAVQDMLIQLRERPIDSLIIADFGLLLHLEEEFPGHFCVHMGTGAMTLNRRTAELYVRHGARRLILSRKIFTPEILSLHEALPDTELEVFMEVNAYCPNFDGLCNYLHNNFVCPGDRCSHVEPRYEEVATRGIFNAGCKLCAIWEYARAGIGYLKIPNRDKSAAETATLLSLVGELEPLASALPKPEFVAEAQRRHRETLGHDCPTPVGCFLARC